MPKPLWGAADESPKQDESKEKTLIHYERFSRRNFEFTDITAEHENGLSKDWKCVLVIRYHKEMRENFTGKSFDVF